MKWKYCIHHGWPEARTEWAEAFLRPHDPGYTGPSLWVTIDCVDPAASTTADSGSDEDDRAIREWLGDRPYRVAENGEAGDADLVVRAADFTMSEFLGWVEVWLCARGFAVTGLIEAPLADFAGTHQHADFLIRLKERHPDDV